MPAAKKNRESLWDLALFIAGAGNAKSMAAYSNLKRICEEYLSGDYQLTLVDVSKDPEIAAREQILAIPTLIRYMPEPRRKIIGDLADTHRVLVSLGLARLQD